MASIDSILFLGSKKLGLECLIEMNRLRPGTLLGVVTIDDRDDTRSTFSQFQRFCSEVDIELYVVRTREESETLIQRHGPQMCMLVCWYWLIGKQCLEGVPDGMLCMHNSLLPAYRGAAPLVWAMINGESRVGVSLFSIAEGIDDGDVWSQEAVEVDEDDYIADILTKTQVAAVTVLRGCYCDILDRKRRPTLQDHSLATYGAFRRPSDGLIDWTQPADKVFNFIRAQSEPYPGAYCFSENARLTIWRAERTSMCYYGLPGQVVRVCDDGVYVVCGNHKPLILLDVEINGERMRADRAIRSVRARLAGTGSITLLSRETSLNPEQAIPG